jgi:hypothetical protein
MSIIYIRNWQSDLRARLEGIINTGLKMVGYFPNLNVGGGINLWRQEPCLKNWDQTKEVVQSICHFSGTFVCYLASQKLLTCKHDELFGKISKGLA